MKCRREFWGSMALLAIFASLGAAFAPPPDPRTDPFKKTNTGTNPNKNPVTSTDPFKEANTGTNPNKNPTPGTDPFKKTTGTDPFKKTTGADPFKKTKGQRGSNPEPAPP